MNFNARYQKGLILSDIYPSINRFCACGCGKSLTIRQKKWASIECRTNAYILFAIIKGDNSIVRQEVFKRDQGYCYNCGVFDDKWQVDHIKPVAEGGSACTINNFQTLCLECHKNKSYIASQRNAISSQAISICLIRNLYAVGAHSKCLLNTLNDKHNLRLATSSF